PARLTSDASLRPAAADLSPHRGLSAGGDSRRPQLSILETAGASRARLTPKGGSIPHAQIQSHRHDRRAEGGAQGLRPPQRPILETPPLGGLDQWRRRQRAGRGRPPSDPQYPWAIAPHAHWPFPPRLTLTKKDIQHARDNRSLRLSRPLHPRRS